MGGWTLQLEFSERASGENIVFVHHREWVCGDLKLTRIITRLGLGVWLSASMCQALGSLPAIKGKNSKAVVES